VDHRAVRREVDRELEQKRFVILHPVEVPAKTERIEGCLEQFVATPQVHGKRRTQVALCAHCSTDDAFVVAVGLDIECRFDALPLAAKFWVGSDDEFGLAILGLCYEKVLVNAFVDMMFVFGHDSANGLAGRLRQEVYEEAQMGIQAFPFFQGSATVVEDVLDIEWPQCGRHEHPVIKRAQWLDDLLMEGMIMAKNFLSPFDPVKGKGFEAFQVTMERCCHKPSCKANSIPSSNRIQAIMGIISRIVLTGTSDGVECRRGRPPHPRPHKEEVVMLPFLQSLCDRASASLGAQPLFSLLLGVALVAVFLQAALKTETAPSLAWTIWIRLGRLVWATTLTALLLGAAMGLSNYLDRTAATFRHGHGRVTEVNLDAVRTIWGPEQAQGNLSVSLRWEEEQLERLESEDPTRPTVTRKKKVVYTVDENPFLSERHTVTLRQSPRKKGTAVYPGYTTDCRFTWRLRNPADRDVKATLRFPLPASSAMYDELAVALNGASVRDRLRIRANALELEQPLQSGEHITYEISFKSRGLSYWYFQVREPREIRDLELKLALPDMPRKSLNYPEGCMTPTGIADEQKGAVLTYRLDRALSNKGMGIEIPKLTQPGELAGAVLGEVRKGWVLLFAALLLGGTLCGYKHTALLATFIAAAVAFAYGLLGDFSGTPLGFWGTGLIVVLPIFLLLLAALRRALPGAEGSALMLQLYVFGLLYPCLAGLDEKRQVLYLNLSALLFLVVAAWQLIRRLRPPQTSS